MLPWVVRANLVAVRHLGDLAGAQLAVLDVGSLAGTNARRLIAIVSAQQYGENVVWEERGAGGGDDTGEGSEFEGGRIVGIDTAVVGNFRQR